MLDPKRLKQAFVTVLGEDGYWEPMSRHPGKLGRASKKRRKKGEMSFIKDQKSKGRFMDKMNLRLKKLNV